MKSITLVLILSIITLIISESNLDNYSVNSFIDSLKSEGLFDIIQSIKEVYGQDVAIISCEELNINHCGFCQKVVTDYMPKFDDDLLKAQEEKPKIVIRFKKFLKNKFSLEEAEKIYESIKQRVKSLK